eukprot:TRINITY_DN23118_c0_g1_i1.p1 TRINITY_DN23118_c0_g1~~TRINITY_DN23118_c0_g1_i1.p1  ORF type:complete len:167 (-),score=26.23 TRINITY_DN23118_c0_g1_i1:305-766(-)
MSASAATKKRLRFLWDLAKQVHSRNPEMSSHYVNQMCRLAASTEVNIPIAFQKQYCSRCCRIFNGYNMTVRPAKNIAKENKAFAGVANVLVFKCDACEQTTVLPDHSSTILDEPAAKRPCIPAQVKTVRKLTALEMRKNQMKKMKRMKKKRVL